MLELQMVTADGRGFTGTGVYIVDNAGNLYLITADHVITDENGRLGEQLSLRLFNADPDDADGWVGIAEVAGDYVRCPVLDLAVFPLTAPIRGAVPARVAATPAKAGDLLVAFGFGSEHGRALCGRVTGLASNVPFLAARLGAGHGDSGGPVFNVAGELIGIISSDASPEMTERFNRQTTPPRSGAVGLGRRGQGHGADTLILHLAAILNK